MEIRNLKTFLKVMKRFSRDSKIELMRRIIEELKNVRKYYEIRNKNRSA